MQVYKVRNNQNIFDVAIAIYGSIEGVFDLFVNNPELSFESTLYGGQELYWDEDFIVYDTIVNSLNTEKIVPINGERHVYYKDIHEPLRCVIQVSEVDSAITLLLAGDGNMIVDWGDNSELQSVSLQPTIQNYTHYFDNVTDSRMIRLYGNFNIKTWDMSPINGLVLPTLPLTVDEIEMKQNKVSLQGLFLFNGTYSVKMNNITISDLSPIQNMSLSYLELKQIDYTSNNTLDAYLKYVAQHNNQRRNCTVVLDTLPSGVYREPSKDTNGNYIITSGMEAIYVITHEDAWNEAGPWVFNICGTIYQYENPNIA